MNPLYDITPRILTLISSISENIERVDASFLDKPSPGLRKHNRIKTIHSTLMIEGNKKKRSTIFIEFMLEVIDHALSQLLDQKGRTKTYKDRMAYFLENGPSQFTRKEYISTFKNYLLPLQVGIF